MKSCIPWNIMGSENCCIKFWVDCFLYSWKLVGQFWSLSHWISCGKVNQFFILVVVNLISFLLKNYHNSKRVISKMLHPVDVEIELCPEPIMTNSNNLHNSLAKRHTWTKQCGTWQHQMSIFKLQNHVENCVAPILVISFPSICCLEAWQIYCFYCSIT